MDAYPPPYVEHNLPLVLLSGLGEEPAKDGAVTGPKRQESGARIFTESPECQSSVLLQAFKSFDGSDYPWTPAPAVEGLAKQMDGGLETVFGKDIQSDILSKNAYDFLGSEILKHWHFFISDK